MTLPAILHSAYERTTANSIVNRKIDFLSELLPNGYKQFATKEMLSELTGKESVTSKNCSYFYYEAVRLISKENWEEIRLVNAVLYVVECYMYHVRGILPEYLTVETAEQTKNYIYDLCNAFSDDENIIYNLIYGFLTAGECLY